MVTAERIASRVVGYEPSFDQRENIKPSYILRNLETFLGERLNVILSKSTYEIKDGVIYGEDMDIPFIEVMKRGVEYRRRLDGEGRVDRKREEAEVKGFLKIEEILCNPNTESGTMMVSISPPGHNGSLYKHNFYDIFTLKEAYGRRFVEARRYSSALAYEEYKDKLEPLHYMGNIVDDADFLRNPIKVDDVFFKTADEIHAYLHREHKTTKEEDFEKVLRACRSLSERYVQTGDITILNAIMNKADMEAGLIENKLARFYGSLDQEINFLGKEPVRQAATGCGSSGGFSTNSTDKKLSSSPFSVSDFGEINYEFDEPGPCKKCGSDVNCGPCGICRSCDIAIRKSQKFSPN